ncbi:hypothetical protein CHUAL_003268 [Chamberlinius hualienensis]
MAGTVIRSKLNVYVNARYTRHLSTKASVTTEVPETKVKPFSEVPKHTENPKKHFFKTLINVFGKHKEDFRRDIHFEKVYAKYGPIVSRGELFGPPTVHLFNPDDIAAVYNNEGLQPKRIAFDTVRLAREHMRDVMRKRGLTVSDGDEWAEMRKKFQNPMLRLQNVENFCTAMDSVAVEFVNHLSRFINDKGEVENLLPEMYKWALESLGLVVFDRHLGALKENLSPDSETYKLLESINDTFVLTYKYELGLPWHHLFQTPSFRKLIEAQKFMAKVAVKYTQATIERVKTMSIAEVEKSNFLIQMMFRKEVDLDDLVAMITDIFFGGIDTTSHSTAMLMYHLARNQSVQERLSNDIKTVLPDSNAVVTHIHISNLPFLKACFKETHRLTPVVDAVSRVLRQDLVLGGYQVPAGTNIIIHHRTMGKVLFDSPNEFKPERWLRGDPAYKKYNMFTWLPFGHGRRACIGRQIAQQETHLLITRVLQKYHLTYNGDEEIHMISRFTNIPNGPLRIKFNLRSP